MASYFTHAIVRRPSRSVIDGIADFANEGKETLDFLSMLDGVVAEAGGALYPAKDARMDEAMFARSCPRLAEFVKYKDPLFSSSLWRRLGEPNFGKGA